jgi:hypothetical protein
VPTTYDLGQDYGVIDGDASHAPHWIIAVVRLSDPLTYSRATASSVTSDLSAGARTRGNTLIITEDCASLNISRSKSSHVKSLSALVLPGHANYLKEVLPGDWLLAWIVGDSTTAKSLRDRISTGQACNGFKDGLKFVGRVDSVRKQFSRPKPNSGAKSVSYAIQAFGFKELDTSIFYDQNLADNTQESQNISLWLARIGLDVQQIFAISSVDGSQKDNVHLLISSFLEVLIGRGVSSNINNKDIPSAIQQFTGGGPASANSIVPEDQSPPPQEAAFAYLVPQAVGDLLGKKSRSKTSGILAYADILTLLFGVQQYTQGGASNPGAAFVPKIDATNKLSTQQHRFTGQPLMGCFLPLMPDFDNRPLWSILQSYLNPVLNEMYTAIRPQDEDGSLVPTLVLRQIPFTTEPMRSKLDGKSSGGNDAITQVKPPYTAYLDLPRWEMPGGLVHNGDIGRSDAARINFVHIYGHNNDVSTSIPITAQLAQNAPIRDDVDIQRSGLHAYMTTIPCREVNQVATTPRVWAELAADWLIGAQYTLSGSLSCVGIHAPVAEGDNLEFDGVVYHIESINDSCQQMPNGARSWSTHLTLTNGIDPQSGTDSNGDTDQVAPMYPGFGLKGAPLGQYEPIVSADGAAGGALITDTAIDTKNDAGIVTTTDPNTGVA